MPVYSVQCTQLTMSLQNTPHTKYKVSYLKQKQQRVYYQSA